MLSRRVETSSAMYTVGRSSLGWRIPVFCVFVVMIIKWARQGSCFAGGSHAMGMKYGDIGYKSPGCSCSCCSGSNRKCLVIG
eukprot:scaffold22660_cov127-Cylindrotheca_fusiformis.AAC.4